MMKQKILTLLKSYDQGLTRKQIEEALQIETSNDFILFSNMMDELEDTYQILRLKENQYILPDTHGYKTGVIDLNNRGYATLRNEEITIPMKNLNGALQGDTVVVHENAKSGNYEVIGIQRHAHELLVGTFESQKGKLKCVVNDPKISKLNYSIHLPKDFHPSEGLCVLLKVVKYSPLKLEIEREIGHKDDPDVDILSILLPHQIDPIFPEEVKMEANLIAQEIKEEDLVNRHDERDVSYITMDGADSKDFDDAVYVEKNQEGWLLKVAIADVSYYVQENSPLDLEAYKRGTSTYAIQSVVPMLPHVLSNGICSLNPQVDRLAITCAMQVDSNGNIKNHELYPSVICSKERMTYENTNKIYDGDSKLSKQYEHIVPMLLEMKDCANAIRKQRERKGAIDFESGEAEIIVNERGYAIDVKKKDRGIGERVIEDFMIAANISVAKTMRRNEFPCIYRVHGEPDIKRLQSFKAVSNLLGCPLILRESSIRPKELQEYLDMYRSNEYYPILANLLLRCMQKATYDSKCIGHYGIAEEYYLHFTSPIRRYPDLIVHRMLRKYLFEKHPLDKEYVFDCQKMDDLALQSSIRERESVEAEREADNMKKAEYMQGQLGAKYKGVISSVLYYGFYVQLENTVEGFVSIHDLAHDYYTYDESKYALIGESHHRMYQLGDKVEVIVTGANKALGLIDFEVVEKETAKTQPTKKHQTRSRAKKKEERVKRGKRK